MLCRPLQRAARVASRDQAGGEHGINVLLAFADIDRIARCNRKYEFGQPVRNPRIDALHRVRIADALPEAFRLEPIDGEYVSAVGVFVVVTNNDSLALRLQFGDCSAVLRSALARTMHPVPVSFAAVAYFDTARAFFSRAVRPCAVI